MTTASPSWIQVSKRALYSSYKEVLFLLYPVHLAFLFKVDFDA